MLARPIDILIAADDAEAVRLGYQMADGYRLLTLVALGELAGLHTCFNRLHSRYIASIEHARDLRAAARTT